MITKTKMTGYIEKHGKNYRIFSNFPARFVFLPTKYRVKKFQMILLIFPYPLAIHDKFKITSDVIIRMFF